MPLFKISSWWSNTPLMLFGESFTQSSTIVGILLFSPFNYSILDSFSTYFVLGLQHITDLDAYDHMLFVLALICNYRINELKQILILITAFTLGHSITLALAVFDVVVVNAAVIEFLIPVTIFLTSVYNLLQTKSSKQGFVWKYLTAGFFGLIHGMGFSNYLRMLLGNQQNLFEPLLAFNLGIEAGQVIFVLLILLIMMLCMNVIRIKQRDWILVISGATAAVSLMLMKDSIFW